MQAAQSNNASKFFNSDFPGTRSAAPTDGQMPDLPSPFSVPIQAARNYLERQRNSGTQIASREEPALSVYALTTAVARTREQVARDQDRRLERSLYEGNSIEAGLNFELPHDFTESQRAFLTDSDGAEPLFAYADSCAVSDRSASHDSYPTPENVRSAISRLARKSVAFQKSSKTSPTQAPLGSTVGPQAEWSVRDQPGGQPPSSLEFADVARQVWKSHSDAIHPEARLATVPWEVAGETAAPRPVSRQPEELQPHTAQTRPTISPDAETRILSAFEDSALAHDACNLLSALGLYSEFLNLPGVLAVEHRHYAEELQLIADRSQSLISRMFNFGKTKESQTGRVEGGKTTPKSKGDVSVAPNPGVIPLLTSDPIRIPDPTTADETVAVAGVTPATNLVDLLMRWGSLLSTLAHGTLDVCFGPHAATSVPMDAEPLERILVNLVRNARAATLAGGAIRIGVGTTGEDAASGSGDTIALTVDDSGCGMTEVQINRILGACVARLGQPEVDSLSEATSEFVSDGYGRWEGNGSTRVPEAIATGAGLSSEREDTQRDHWISKDRPFPAGNGSRRGLGLEVVKDLVSASGGKLTIQSSLGRGTRIEICWPIAAAAAIEAFPETGSTAVTQGDPLMTPGTVVLAEAPPAEVVSDLELHLPLAATSWPDEFSEAELRLMMLRLHRSSHLPEDASRVPKSTLDGSTAILSTRPAALAGVTVSSSTRNRFEALRLATDQPDSDNYAATKGQIAC